MHDLWDRWLGVGLATLLGVATLVLTATDRLSLYINPSSSWFAVAMAVVAVGVGVAGIAMRRGLESDHGHDHGDGGAHGHGSRSAGDGSATTMHDVPGDEDSPLSPQRLAPLATATGGSLASVVVLAAWALPATTLSVDVAASRASDTPALFGGEETVELARSGDTESFGIPEWATVFASTTTPETFRGDQVELLGFVMEDPDSPDRFLLTRMVITHCAIDAQPAYLPVTDAGWQADLEAGDWVDVSGTITLTDGSLAIDPTSVTPVDQPEDPYEY
ncbi:TIGR03943 family protein [Demequina sp. NBRC 110053]|uniref:TIGR03943 family putative permease subunit n=1 Tax=Demequina sp. NBRC 110053 TaxID=1570342 RepID=UPI000A05FC20|nr:TIGR03943 family protein [Demequina sp. NBRC 110053]